MSRELTEYQRGLRDLFRQRYEASMNDAGLDGRYNQEMIPQETYQQQVERIQNQLQTIYDFDSQLEANKKRLFTDVRKYSENDLKRAFALDREILNSKAKLFNPHFLIMPNYELYLDVYKPETDLIPREYDPIIIERFRAKKIHIMLIGEDNGTMRWNMRLLSTFQRLMYAYGSAVGELPEHLRFVYKGQVLTSVDTPIDVNMKHGDCIKVYAPLLQPGASGSG